MIHIQVTQEHIDKGTRKNPGCCPIALALREMGCQFIEVDSPLSVIDDNIYRISMLASRFIADFDAGLSVKPFEFDAVLDEND